MAGLFPTENGTLLAHFLHHIAVADTGDHVLDAHFLQGLTEPHVAHDCADDDVVFEPASAFKMSGTDGQYLITRQSLTGFIHCNQSVAITVKGKSDFCTGFPHLFGQYVRVL
jgi:hypothetical protein